LAASAWPEGAVEQKVVLARAEVIANPDAAISHQSAALIWRLPCPGLEGWHHRPVSVTLPNRVGHGSQRRCGVHHVSKLPGEHVARDEFGYCITSLARTAVDLSDGLELPQALVILDAAARQLCASYVGSPRCRDYLNSRLADAARAELSGVAQRLGAVRLLPMIAETDPARESAAESLSAGYFKLAGLPEPRHQVGIETPAGLLFPDCYWPQSRLVGECDGALKYAEASGYVREKEREQVLRDLGYPVVRWLAKEIMLNPQQVVERVRRALAVHQ